MNLLEQYPEYAMRTNKSGERETKPWVSGPSPMAQGLLTAGLGMLAQPEDTSGWVTEGGGFDPSNIARGALLGLQTYQGANQNLQDQRSNFYTHQKSLQDQVIQAQKAKRDAEEAEREQNNRRTMIEGFPKLLETLSKTNIPGIQNRIPTLRMQAESGDIKGAYQTASNLNSQLAQVTKGKPEIMDLGNRQKIIIQKDSNGSYSVGPQLTKNDIGGLGGNRGKAISVILKADAGKTEGLTLDSPIAIAAYEELQKPTYTTEFDKITGEYIRKQVPGYVPPSIQTIMGGTSGQSPGSTVPPTTSGGIVTKQKPLTVDEKKSAGYGNRMQKAMYEMDTLMSSGYRPSRIVLEYVKMGAPQTIIGRGEKETYRKMMNDKDRQYARAVQDWLRAKLRKESGAVIGVDEAAEEVEAFFNVLSPGSESSSDDLYNTFRNSRVTALESMIGESGDAWQRWGDLGYSNEPRNSSYFYENSPFQKPELTKAEKIKNRFK